MCSRVSRSRAMGVLSDAVVSSAVRASCAFVQGLQGTALHEEHSRLQAERLLTLFASGSLSSGSIQRTVSTLVDGAGFCVGDLRRLVDALGGAAAAAGSAGGHPAVSAATAPKPGRQDFTNYFAFLKKVQWDHLLAGEDDVVTCLKEFLAELGLRNPCEKTCAAVTAGVVLCTESEAKIKMMSSSCYNPIFQAVKKELRGAVGQPPIGNLPGTPELLKQGHPEFYRALYGSGSPARCPFSTTQIAFVRSQIRCRGEAKSSGLSAVMQHGEVSAMGNAMAESMQRLADNQAQLLQWIGARGGGGGELRLTFPQRGDVRALRDSQPPQSPLRVPLPTFAGRVRDGGVREDTPLRRCEKVSNESMGESAESAAMVGASPAPGAAEEKGDDAEEEATDPPKVGLADKAVTAPEESSSPTTEKGKATKASGKAAMALVLGAVSKRETAKIAKRPAAAGGGRPKKPKTVGEARYTCEWSREQFMGRTGKSGPGSTKRFPFAEHGGREEALKACKAWVDDINKKQNA